MACKICGGTVAEHEGRQHQYTETPGDLKGPEKPQQPPVVMRMGGAQTNEAQAMNRMLEVLVGRGLLESEDAFYVATGTKLSGKEGSDG